MLFQHYLFVTVFFSDADDISVDEADLETTDLNYQLYGQSKVCCSFLFPLFSLSISNVVLNWVITPFLFAGHQGTGVWHILQSASAPWCLEGLICSLSLCKESICWRLQAISSNGLHPYWAVMECRRSWIEEQGYEAASPPSSQSYCWWVPLICLWYVIHCALSK